MEDGKNESGFILLYVLGAIILISIIVGGIFFLARTVFSQIEKVDQFKRIKQVEEYAMQEGTNKIQKEIEVYISELETISFGEDISVISDDMDRLFSGFSVSEEDIGIDNQFSYQVNIEKIVKEKAAPYVLSNSEGDFGWKEDTSATNSKVINAQFTFEIKVEVYEKQKDGKIVQSSSKLEYVYQIQWNDIEVAESVNELDVWRNVVYSYNFPNSARYLSADSWMRKMDDIYRYNENHSTFDYSEFDNFSAKVMGFSNGVLTDITDNSLLDFSSNGKMLHSTLTFEGSLLLEAGIQFEGNSSASQLLVGNLLSLRADGHKENFIQNLNVVAGSGTVVDLSGRSGYLAINEKDSSFQTSGLLINHTPKSTNASLEGVLFGSGNLFIQTQTKSRDFSFANYSSSALKSTPQDGYWNEFIKGSMVIASSNFYAGALSLGDNIQSFENDQRKILVDGNFLLTNARLDSDKGQDGFSYFQEEGLHSQPNAPSTLTLDGSNTTFVVEGMTFIDAPKTERRKTLTETTENSSKYFGDKEDWNTIILKNGSVMKLGYTGVEPFNLILNKNSVLSFDVLPDLAYFDPTFLVNSVNEGNFNGKVILYVFNQDDAEKLKNELEKKRVPVNVLSNEEDIQNGEVSIIKPDNVAGPDTTQIISRTFSYVNKVN